MLAILLPIALLLLFLIFCHPERDWRSALMSASVILGVLTIAFIEILSVFKLLTFATVLSAWSLSVIVLGWIYYRKLKQRKEKFDLYLFFKLTPVSYILLGGIVFIVAVIGLISIVSPPNNWDSMTYHMSRVVHWIQNQSVAHYPTYDSAQLVHPPFA
jgi:amino acid transporter